ncbi:MAG: DoxX family membrane protein [Chthoniobacterales bacterium]
MARHTLGAFLARVAVGLLFFLSSRTTLFSGARRQQMRQTFIEAHVPFPGMNAALVSTVEFVVSAGGALPRDSHLAVLLRAWKAQH